MKRIIPFLSIFFVLISCNHPEVDIYGSIAGVVKDSQSKMTIDGVRVTLSPGGISQLTGTDGTFSFEDLTSGEYTLAFTCDAYEDASEKLSVKAGTSSNVQISMNPILPKISVSTNVLTFGEETTTMSIDIINAGKGILEWDVNEKLDWIECYPTSGKIGSESSTIIVDALRETLDQGNYSGSFVISSNGGSATILVSISVNGITLEVEPSELDFGTISSSQTLTLLNTATGTLSYEATSTNNWLTLSKTSGNITQKEYLTVIVSREGLSAGKYDASIVFSTKKGVVAIPVKMQVAVNEKPTITIEEVDDIKYNSVVLKGTIVSAGSSKITKYGFCWSEKDNPTLSDNYSNLGDCSEPKSFESFVTDLSSDTKYYCRTYAENAVGISYSEKVLSFTTAGLPSLPTVTSGAISEVSSRSAIAKGNLVSFGNVDHINHFGHVWSTTAKPTLESGRKTDLGSAETTKSFVSNLCELTPATTYYVRAYATNEKGTSYGEDVTFQTDKDSPVVSTGTATDVVHNAATCSGELIYDGGHTITEIGICWSKKAQPKYADNHLAATPSSEKEYTCRITGLNKETRYYYRAYVKTSDDEYYYGDDAQLTTTKEVSLAMLDDVSIANITTNAASFTSRISSDGNSKISECGFCWSDAAEPTTIDNKAECDPSSADMGKTIKNLKEGTLYFVRAYAKNSMGTAYSETASFTTQAITVPSLSPISITNIGKTTAYVSADVINDGNADVTQVGFCWSTSPNPSIYDNYVNCQVSSTFSTKIIGLPEQTTIYVRAYATNSKGTGYSEGLSFMTTNVDIDVWDGSIASSFNGGSGSNSSPIIISSGSQLALLSRGVKNGNKYDGICFSLSSNISLNGIEWQPIGTESTPFAGIFIGNDYTISGLHCAGSSDYVGLFGNNSGRITNLHVSGTVSGNNYVGGVCGSSTGFITDCRNYCEVIGNNYIGGITGYLLGMSVHECINYGNISGRLNTGGIIGYVEKGFSAANCANYGNVSSSQGCAGGIIGYYDGTNRSGSNSKIINSANYYCITGATSGGICGEAHLYSYVHGANLIVENCINNNTIVSSNNNYGAILGAYYKSGSNYKLTLSNTFWLYDISNQVGAEKGIGNQDVEFNWYSRTSNSCNIKGGDDLVTQLNNFYQGNDTEYFKWKYEYVDGYARPVFDK